MKKKLLLSAVLVMSAIVLVVATVFTTIAYLSYSTAVTNSFSVGNIKIHMYESAVDENGEAIPNDPNLNGTMKDSTANNYHLIYGKEYVKDPTIYVDAGCDPSYLFVKVRNQISTIEAENDSKIADQMEDYGWKLLTSRSTGDIYVFNGSLDDVTDNTVYPDVDNKFATIIPKANQTQVYNVFDKFTISTDKDISSASGAKVTITAFAIQADTFFTLVGEDKVYGNEIDVKRAWNAITEEFPFETEKFEINS